MIETGIALSGVVLGLLIAFAVKAPIWVAAVIVGVFSRSSTAMPTAPNCPRRSARMGTPWASSSARAFFTSSGIGLGVLTRSETGRYAVRGAGGVIALVGAAFLFGLA
jgi:urease accessory protein